MEEIVKDLEEIKDWYEIFLDCCVMYEKMSADEVVEYQKLSEKFQKTIDKLK